MLTRATVTRITAAGPFVVAPGLAGDLELGPCIAAQTTTALLVGDRVLVSYLDGTTTDLAVVARLP